MNNLTNKLEHTETSGVYAANGEQLGASVAILGGVHGNEMAGVEAVKQLIAKSQQQPIYKGKLIAAFGNIAAMQANKRYLDQDLNRSFGDCGDEDFYEVIRAGELKPFLAETDILFDIHSTIKPSDPFVVVPNQNGGLSPQEQQIVSKLGIPTILTGTGLWHPGGQPIYADTYVQAHGGLGMTIEAGWIQDPKTLQIAHGVNAALHHLGIFEGTYPESLEEVKLKIWNAYKNVVASPGFTFMKNGSPAEWGNWEELPVGTLYAIAKGKDFVAEKDSYIIFPKSKEGIKAGTEACILVDAKSV